MLATQNKEREFRRALNKRGLRLCKSRVQNIHADNLGGYMIVDAVGNYVVSGSRYEMSLDDVEMWLKE